MRFRFALAVMVAGMLSFASVASAQTATEPLSDYTNTSTTKTQQAAPTETSAPSAPAAEGQEENSVAPSVAAQSAPDNLAFTGGEPLLLIALGLALAGGTATLLVRDRRRGSQNQ